MPFNPDGSYETKACDYCDELNETTEFRHPEDWFICDPCYKREHSFPRNMINQILESYVWVLRQIDWIRHFRKYCSVPNCKCYGDFIRKRLS